MDVPRKISPPLSELESLRQPLEQGEWSLLRALDDQLPIHWEIYIQPHLNGLCPDFVILSPRVGVVIIEVKDWDFSGMNYRWREVPGSRIRSLYGHKGSKEFRVENPIAKAKLYQDELLNLYCPLLGIGKRYTPVVSSIVYFSKLSSHEAKRFVEASFVTDKIEERVINKYYPAIGYDFSKLGLSESIPFFAIQSSKYMKEEYAQSLRYWLDEPRAKREQRVPIVLSGPQEKLLNREKTKNGFRRIRGSAGSGKTLLLAKKAANLAIEGRRVLVVSYNITLGNYISDLIARAAPPQSGVRKLVEVVNYHAWAKRICVSFGYEAEYEGLPWKAELEATLNDYLPELINRALSERSSDIVSFDAVLVDEGQDFRLLWWQNLARVVAEDGEALLVADKTQDLYETASAWTESAMTSAGFRGPWNELSESYRLPTDYFPYIVNFLDRFITQDRKILPEHRQVQKEISLGRTQMCWIQTDTAVRAIDGCVEAVLKLPLRKRADDNLVYPDIVVLAETRKSGFEIVKKLGSRGVKVRHTFGLFGEGDESEDIRKQKVALFLGAEQVKATTIHSYKGWESTCLVIEILRGGSKSAIAAVYTALTRLKASERGEDSHITVVCSAPELEQYGKTWPVFSRA